MSRLHAPKKPSLSDPHGVALDCVCGWRGVLWSFEEGAERAYVQHCADEAAHEVQLRVEVVVR